MRRLEGTGVFPAGQGWGRLKLVKNLPVTTKKWTDHGERHDRRGLKRRSREAALIVPLPPQLVATLKAHIAELGTADDGRLFRNERGGILGTSTYSRAWEEARQLAFAPAQTDRGPPVRPVSRGADHMAQRGSLAGGRGEAHRQLGEVLLKRYAGCLDSQDGNINRRIERDLEDG